MPDDAVGPADAGDMAAWEALTDREAAFVKAYADPGSDTFGQATASAKVAGYADPRNSGWRVRRRPRVREACKMYVQAAQVSRDMAMLGIERIRRMAEAGGDYSTALRAYELQAKACGAFTERLMISLDENEARRAYDEEEIAEAQRLARLRIDDDGRRALPAAAAASGPSPAKVQGGVLTDRDLRPGGQTNTKGKTDA